MCWLASETTYILTVSNFACIKIYRLMITKEENDNATYGNDLQTKSLLDKIREKESH